MSFWASFTGSVRNVGHRISALFRRKKKRITKESEETNNKLKKNDNAQIQKNFDVREVKSTEHLGLDSKNKNNLSEDLITSQQFTKCANTPKKNSNLVEEEHTTAEVQNSIKMLSAGSNNEGNNSGENAITDINKKYREMEIEVARRVRETMELADARRKAFYASSNAQGTANVTKNIEVISQKIPKAKKDDVVRNQVLGSITNIEQNVTSKIDPIQLEAPSTNEANSEEILQNISSTDSDNNRNLVNIEEYAEPQNDELQAFQIGFEVFQNTFDETINQTKHPENYSIPNTAMTNDSRVFERNDRKQWEQVQAALSLSELAEDKLASGARTNSPSEAIGGSQIEIVEDPIYLTEHGSKNLPYEPIGSDQTVIAEGALYLAQQGARNIDNISYEPSITAKHTDLDTFLLTDEIGNAKNWELAQGALFLAQNAALNVDNTPYDDYHVERQELAKDALNLAQHTTENVHYTSRDATVNNEWLLAEGALQLAQNAAKNIDIKNQDHAHAEAEKQIIDTINQQRQKLQIGFESFEKSFEDSDTN